MTEHGFSSTPTSNLVRRSRACRPFHHALDDVDAATLLEVELSSRVKMSLLDRRQLAHRAPFLVAPLQLVNRATEEVRRRCRADAHEAWDTGALSAHSLHLAQMGYLTLEIANPLEAHVEVCFGHATFSPSIGSVN